MNDPIEMEVVAIDDVAPSPPKPEPRSGPDPTWRQWQGRVRQLDARWWPLWVLLGIIVIFLLLTVGVLLGLLMLVVKIIGSVIRGMSRVLMGDFSSNTLR